MPFKRAERAIKHHKEKYERLPQIQADAKSSLDMVCFLVHHTKVSLPNEIQLFQIRTIEQNQIAIDSEINNKAILVFTIVTIIFLPLSFFTSYFGMNLPDIAHTGTKQATFWAVCGSVTVAIVSVTVLFGFKTRIGGWMGRKRAVR